MFDDENTSAPANPTITIPAAAVAADGVNPEAGDTIDFSATATVRAVHGDRIEIVIESANGEPVGEPVDTDADMLRAAEEADADSY